MQRALKVSDIENNFIGFTEYEIEYNPENKVYTMSIHVDSEDDPTDEQGLFLASAVICEVLEANGIDVGHWFKKLVEMRTKH